MPHQEGRMERGTRLAREAFSVIRRDRRLLMLPAATLLVDLVTLGVFLGIAASVSDRDTALWIALAAMFYPATASSTFFNVALVHIIHERWHGRPAGIRDGLAAARRQLGPILGWSLIAATVGVALQLVQRLGPFGLVERLVAIVLSVGWGVATFFVVPALALEGVGPVTAFKRSAETVRRRWAEGTAGAVVIGASALIVLIPALIVGFVGVLAFASHPATGIVALLIAALLILPTLLYLNATSTVFSLAVWEYANSGTAHGAFQADDLAQPFVGGGGVAKTRRWLTARLPRRKG